MAKHKESTKKKFKRVMTEFKEGKLHSGSKTGPKVKNPKQAVAIAYSEQSKADESKGMKKAMRKRKSAPKPFENLKKRIKHHLEEDMGESMKSIKKDRKEIKRMRK